MMPINSNTIVEVNVEMTLSLTQARQLVFFLKTAVSQPRPIVAEEVPQTNIVADLANCIQSSMLKQGIEK